MKQERRAKVAPATKRVTSRVETLSGDEVKTRLRERGLTLKAWAKQHSYPYETVSCVVRGINRGNYGMGHRIAVALGMKREA